MSAETSVVRQSVGPLVNGPTPIFHPKMYFNFMAKVCRRDFKKNEAVVDDGGNLIEKSENKYPKEHFQKV
jgi:hypothetical protein